MFDSTNEEKNEGIDSILVVAYLCWPRYGIIFLSKIFSENKDKLKGNVVIYVQSIFKI